MKKVFVIILSILYLGTTSGASIHLHYCMDKLVSMSLLAGEEGKCSKCGMDKAEGKKKSCCNDEQKQVKVDEEQKVASAFNIAPLVPAIVTSQAYPSLAANLPVVERGTPLGHAPPRRLSNGIYILNCSFLI